MSEAATKPGNIAWQEDRYREILRTPQKSALLVKIWRDAFEDDYPEDADPFSFVTLSDLIRFAQELKLQRGAKLLDVGCGRGGPGLWIARKTGAVLAGIDVLSEAIVQANALSDRWGLSGTSTFLVGSFTETRLPSLSVQAIMSVDSFWMVLDKRAALQEMSRVIQPGGRFVMTTWLPSYMEIGSMLNTAGFQLISCDESARWKDRQMAVYRGILKNRRELVSEIGAASAEVLISEARQAPERLSSSPRYFIVAERLE